ncbi:hypothetical protein EGR_11214 [Echinococcus granulosus]|uniref:Uncharacterized protein n=1 Tax=Echinococcus granulosus TaxID=6210 RepID=W6UK86_ECHGR|nr:hypothetical protein EGR_11214 [Echinococcus granulosus]EUB53929.1 hypothetical protein EGR_11214 [Echinococcus granulosus]
MSSSKSGSSSGGVIEMGGGCSKDDFIACLITPLLGIAMTGRRLFIFDYAHPIIELLWPFIEVGMKWTPSLTCNFLYLQPNRRWEKSKG